MFTYSTNAAMLTLYSTYPSTSVVLLIDGISLSFSLLHDKDFLCSTYLRLSICNLLPLINTCLTLMLGNNTKLRYNHNCFARRIRYHTAPSCERIEREVHQVVPVTSWKWMLKNAMEEQCRMPDVSNIILAGETFSLVIYYIT